jgi:serine/threonine-protein kinase
VIVGTPRFLSPEQALGGAVDSRADLYATGVVLYWLLTGRDPFQHHRNVLAIVQAHVSEPPVPPSVVAPYAVPPAVDRAVLRALKKRPRDRFSSAEEFAAELLRSVQPKASTPRWSRTEPLDTRPFQRARQEIDRPTVKLAVLALPPAQEPEVRPHPYSAPSEGLRARALVTLAMLFLALVGGLILLLRTRA